jgi:flagellar hook protein FlgE
MPEEANVEVARMATNMLANQRAFGANQTVFSTSDETLAQAVRDVGRVG